MKIGRRIGESSNSVVLAPALAVLRAESMGGGVHSLSLFRID